MLQKGNLQQCIAISVAKQVILPSIADKESATIVKDWGMMLSNVPHTSQKPEIFLENLTPDDYMMVK